MQKIQLADMAPHVHTFFRKENKVEKLSKWLIAWIMKSLKDGKIKPGDMLPPKGELACHIGVSLGTMQNVFRFVEDAGYIESKQKIGTYIKTKRSSEAIKLTSKKDLAGDTIKKFLKDNDYKKGDALPSLRRLSKLIGVSQSTLRVAISNLILQGILEHKKNLFVLTGRSFKINNIETETLVEKVAEKIKKIVKKSIKPGNKIPSNTILAKDFNVSIKTIHDAIKQLSKEGFLYTRRGRYGTIYLNNNKDLLSNLYNYEKIEQKIRTFISKNCNVGDKLPSIKILSREYNTSEKTIKKALDNLSEEGFLTFMRGRWGGTFITDIPKSSKESYAWLALNSEYLN